MSYTPKYIELDRTGELAKRVDTLYEILKECRLCPRQCGVNRMEGEAGFCNAGKELIISSIFAHFGEEPPLVGLHGSGTIFLTHCNLRCIFCQNYDISHLGKGELITTSIMAKQMLRLQNMGCHNINFVTPTHYVPQIVASLPEAIRSGLNIPLVFNCGGYESQEIIRLLDGIIDIYMPDVKFFDGEVAKKYTNAPDYPEVVKDALKQMHIQVGDLKIGKDGIAKSGLLIRHMVMPFDLAGTSGIVKFIASEISRDSYVNIMAQYRPMYKSHEFPELSRRITPEEYRKAKDIAKNLGLHRGF